MRRARAGAKLGTIEAVAGRLWLMQGGADVDGAVKHAVDAFWAGEPGDDPYWDAMSARTPCGACGEVNRLENLSVCPNCFAVYCYRHGRDCVCGHPTLG